MDLYFKEEWRAPAAMGVLSFAVGMGVGYWFSNRRLGQVVEEIVTETTGVTDIKVELVDDDERRAQLFQDFQKAAETAKDAIPDQPAPRWASDTPPKHMAKEEFHPPGYQGVETSESQTTDNSWNQEDEEEDRSPDAPYTIHKDEFESNETDYRQTTLEYFSSDDILCDEKRVPIYNASHVVGKLEFGHGSGDPDIVFVRNEKLESEFEVVRFHTSYQAEVLGLEAEEQAEEQDLKHSNFVPKFRLD